MLDQGFLQITVTQSAGSQALLKILGRLSGRDEFEQLHGQVLFRVRLWLLRRAAVHYDAHDLFAGRLFLAENLNGIAVALAHLLPISA